MPELFRLLATGSSMPFVLAVIVLGAMAILAPVLKLEAKAWFLRRRGVGKKQLAAWALAEAKKDRPNPLVEIFRAMRGRSS